VPKVNVISGAGSFATLMTAFNMERLHNSIYSLAFAQAPRWRPCRTLAPSKEAPRSPPRRTASEQRSQRLVDPAGGAGCAVALVLSACPSGRPTAGAPAGSLAGLRLAALAASFLAGVLVRPSPAANMVVT
jgi:hypothetical protein